MVDIVFLFCTVVISLSCIVYFLSRKTIQKMQSRVFLWLMIFVTVSAASDIVSNYIENTMTATGTLFTVQYATQIIFFTTHSLLAPLYALYIVTVNGTGIRRSPWFYVVFMLPVAVVEALLLTNPWTERVFHYDVNADYVRGPWIYVTYVIAGVYLIISIYHMIRYRKAVTTTTNVALWYFFSFTLVGIVVQLLRPEYKVELFAESISLMGVMLMIENEDELLDPTTRVYNRRAFMNENRRLISTGHRYAVISMNMTNFRLYTRMMSYNAMAETLQTMMAWMRGMDPDVTVYRITTNSIGLIVLYHEESQVDEIVEMLRERFTDGWVHGSVSLELNTIIRVAMVPEELSDPDMLLELAEEGDEVEHTGVQVQRGGALYYITRRAQVEEALKRALLENRFEVYYQPIYDASEDRICSAEALLRLNDPELGFLPPEELIPIAERNGLIAEIGLRVFDEVCAFLAEQRTKRLGLHYIEVNLSIYQLLTGDTRARFAEILEKYNVAPEQINLEITETASLSVASTPVGSIQELKEDGFTFSLDDYGTGYSNLTYIISMDFLNIKSDKGLLWDADTNENSRMLLGDTIRMLRRLGVNVIQEGVETREQLDYVLEAGANLIQGFYFARPMRQDAFVDYVERFQGRAAVDAAHEAKDGLWTNVEGEGAE